MSDAKGEGTNEGALWGARFATGPSPELAALSRSTHFDWDLALYDIAGSHAHAKALAAAGYLTADEERAMHGGLDMLARGITDGTLLPGPHDEDVHGALEQALIAVVGPELGGKLRARAAAATTRSRRSCGCTCSITRARSRATSCGWSTRWSRRPRRTPMRSCPVARTCSMRSPCCSRTTCRRTRWPLVRDLERLPRLVARAPPSRRTAGERSPARRSGSTPSSSPASSASPARPRTRSTARLRATSWPSSRSSRR